jgi:hypothetical protein
MMQTRRAAIILAACASLTQCAGYRIDGAKPPSLAKVRGIAVPMFSNATPHPRAEALATSAVAAAIVRDGRYRIADADDADAVLEGEVASINYSSIRGRRLDTLLPEELANTVTLRWTLRDARNPVKELASGSSKGTSQLFVSSNLQTARNNALPEALEKAAEGLVSRISNGF